jgi:hypothetical protein
MAERAGDYQEEVLSDLLDLQAELRGEPREAPEPPIDEAGSVDGARPDQDVLTVAASGLEVSVAPAGATVTRRLAALNQRLSRLETSLSRMNDRIDDVEAQPAPPSDADAPWRSFLDLQRIVADRLDRR